MDTGVLRGFATRARTDLLREVRGRLEVVLGQGSSARTESPGAVAALERTVSQDGREAVVDRVAYTWFNRIIALRFMDANGYTAAGVVSPEAGKATGQPQVLAEAKGGDFDTAVVNEKMQAAITALLNGTRPSTDPQGEAYGLLLEAYCRYWNKAMPFMFEREGDYTELLMPGGLLATESVRDRAVKTLTEEACSEVEVIGWLYQFYISERKAEVFAGFKQNKKAGPAEIPAATQLFTPHWIVRYLVENSLGRLWLLNHPESRLVEQMDYYIKPVDEETEFLKISTPEELKIIDPAAGSGHMLTYAFDLLFAIYEEESYSPSEIPAKILEHNLYGVEIDPRAGALAAFALTMKATAKRKLFLKNPVQPNICVLQNIHFEQADLDYLWEITKNHPKYPSISRSDFDALWNVFEHAESIGSLVLPSRTHVADLELIAARLDASGTLLAAPTRRVLSQARVLTELYSVVVTNPPYMGSANLDGTTRDQLAKSYKVTRSDLYIMFIERALTLSATRGLVAMVTMQSWMFTTSYEVLREKILNETRVVTLAQLGRGAFDSISGEVVSTAAFILARAVPTATTAGAYVRAVHGVSAEKAEEIRSGGSLSVPQNLLQRIPGYAMVYWEARELARIFAATRPLSDSSTVREGIHTGDNKSYLRYWWEVSHSRLALNATSDNDVDLAQARWVPYNKGGAYTRWYGNNQWVIAYDADARRAMAKLSGHVRPSQSLYFKAGATWSDVGSAGLALKYFPSGYLFDGAGPVVVAGNTPIEVLLGGMNSKPFSHLAELLMPNLHYKSGTVQKVPFPRHGQEDRITELVNQAISLTRRDSNYSELSFEFSTNQLLSEPLVKSLSEASDRSLASRALALKRLEEIESENDEIYGQAYGVNLGSIPGVRPPGIRVPISADLVAEFVSYAVACMFGRYYPDEPGLILANQGDTLREYHARAPSTSFMPDADNVIPVLDGEWFEDDIVAKFRQFLRVALGEEHFEENLKFVIDSLGVKDLRDYFVKSFYKDHVQRYKKRPIYWLFSSPKGSFNALVYLHRYNPSTVSTVLNEYLREYIKKLEVSVEQQEYVVTSGASAREVAAAQREADRLRKVLLELADYERDLFLLAARQIPLDLDDGVLVNYQKLGTALKDIGLKKANNDE